MDSTLIVNGDIKYDGLRLIGSELCANRDIKTLKIRNVDLYGHRLEILIEYLIFSSIEHLKIINSSLRDEDLGCFERYLIQTGILKSLYLDGNLLTADGIKPIIRAVPAGLYCTLTTLSLSGNMIGCYGLHQMSKILDRTLLVNLYLSNCNLSIIADEFLKTLSRNYNLEILDLSHNPIGDKDICKIGGMIAINSTLKHINLKSIYMFNRGLKALVDGVKTNSTLDSLLLDGSFDDERDQLLVFEIQYRFKKN